MSGTSSRDSEESLEYEKPRASEAFAFCVTNNETVQTSRNEPRQYMRTTIPSREALDRRQEYESCLSIDPWSKNFASLNPSDVGGKNEEFVVPQSVLNGLPTAYQVSDSPLLKNLRVQS